MSDGSEQAPQDSGSVSPWGRLLPQEGQVVSGLEEAEVGWGQVRDKGGKEGAGRLASSCPLYSGCPLPPPQPRPQQRSLDGPGSEQGMCQC